MGGFDLFARMPGVDDVEFWQSNAGWLAGNATMQVSQFSTGCICGSPNIWPVQWSSSY